MYQNQEPISAPLTLDDAIARTLKYNLENRLKMMEEALSVGQVDLARMDMLPKLVAAAGYSTRNNDLVTDSMNVSTGQPIVSNAISQDRTRTTTDLAFSWNALDFGVSYHYAHQQADRSLIVKERRRKTVQMLMQQVRHAYWLASGAQVLEGQFEPLLKNVNLALANADRVEKEKLRPPLEILNYRKSMLEIVRQIEGMRDELAQAKPSLAALMNLAPGTPFELVVPVQLAIPKVTMTLAQMEEKSLMQRPELFEADLQERISVAETKKALLRMLPGIEIYAGPHYDSNSYLHNNQWADAGVRVSWNLFSLFSAPKQREAAKMQVEISRVQRLALNMAVLTQTHVALREYAGRTRQYELSQTLFEIDQKILEHTHAAAANDAQSKVNEIRSGVAALMSEYRRYQSYAALQSTYGQLMVSIGENTQPADVLKPIPNETTSAKANESVKEDGKAKTVNEPANNAADTPVVQVLPNPEAPVSEISTPEILAPENPATIDNGVKQ